jgi:hypothetical protein
MFRGRGLVRLPGDSNAPSQQQRRERSEKAAATFAPCPTNQALQFPNHYRQFKNYQDIYNLYLLLKPKSAQMFRPCAMEPESLSAADTRRPHQG